MAACQQLNRTALEPVAAKGLVRRDGLRTLRCEGSSIERVNYINYGAYSVYCLLSWVLVVSDRLEYY